MQEKPYLPKLGALALALFSLTAPLGTGLAQDSPVEPAAAARLASLTNQVIAGIGEFRRASVATRGAALARL